MKMSKAVSAAAITVLAAVACMTSGTKEVSAKKAENVILDETNVRVSGSSQSLSVQFMGGNPHVGQTGYPITGMPDNVGGGIIQGKLWLA